jgi:hypothetical protein
MSTIKSTNKVRDAVQKCTKYPYFDTKSAGLDALQEALHAYNYGFNWDEVNPLGDEGRLSIPLYLWAHEDNTLGESLNNVLCFSWYRMQTGCYEITAYIS